MQPATQPHGYAPESASCGEALGSTILQSSRNCGWSSLLIDHHRVDPTFEIFDTRPTPDQTIVVMLAGEQEIEAFGGGAWRRALYRAGTAGLTPGGHVDRLRRRPRYRQQCFEKANLYIPTGLFRDLMEEHGRLGMAVAPSPLASLAFQDPFLLRSVGTLLHGMKAGLPDLFAQSAACWIATHLVSAHGGWRLDDAATLRSERISINRIAAVCEFMRCRFAEDLSLGELAAEARISRFYLVREFRRQIGTTPHAYLLRLRVEAACQLLTETELRMKQIAAQCGFGGNAAMRAAFLTRLGLTPSEYRRRRRGA